MTVRERVPARSSDSVDLSDTLDLLASLTQYAEAGAVQPHTLAQAAQHALDRHGNHLDVVIAVAKLHLATGDKGEAGRLLQRALHLAPEDKRVMQLMNEAGIEVSRYAPATPRTVSVQPTSGPRPVFEDVKPPRDPGSAPPEPPASSKSVARPARDDATLRSLAGLLQKEDAQSARTKTTPMGPRVRTPDTAPPTTPRSAAEGSPLLRPTVRMARVAGQPERGRWGKPSDTREPFDSRPDRESPSSDGPRSERSRFDPPTPSPRSERSRFDPPTPSPRSEQSRFDPVTPPPRSVRPARQGTAQPRSGRAATGNLKLLDPNDERRRLDRYELIGEIAAGGMASVFLARSAGVAGFQRFFAIKRLHPHLADEQEFIDMFLDEARLAAGIHHPNVVPILEVGTTDAGYYLVMDYIEGDTLSGVLTRAASAGGLPRPIALRIVLDALHGLHAAHELTDGDGQLLDVVHRDCSPQNILVGIDGSSRLTDFGVARASSRLSTTRSATVKGKLAYLSPEQATGRDLDRRSDLFGMGVILWEVLAGRRLFRADTDGATLSRILVEPIPSLADADPPLPDEVVDAVTKSLTRDAADRFATAADMADAVERAVRDAHDRDLFVASPRDVAAYMRELFGDDVTARRDAVRNWIAQCGEADAASGPRSQGLRRGAPSPSPPSARSGAASPISDASPPSSERSEPPSSDPISSGSEPPSSKTEPSAVHADDAAAVSARESRPSGSMRRPPPEVQIEGGSPPEPAIAEADTTMRSSAIPAVPDPTSEPAAPPAPVPKQASLDRRRPLPVPLIVFAIVLVVFAIATYLHSKRSKTSPPEAPPPAATNAR